MARDNESLVDIYRRLGFSNFTKHLLEEVCLEQIRVFEWHHDGETVPASELRLARNREGIISMAKDLLIENGVGEQFWDSKSEHPVDSQLRWPCHRHNILTDVAKVLHWKLQSLHLSHKRKLKLMSKDSSWEQSPASSMATDVNFNDSVDLTGVPDMEEPSDTKSETSEPSMTNHCNTDNDTAEHAVEESPNTQTSMKPQRGPTGHLFRFHLNETQDGRLVSRTWHPVKSFWDMTRRDLEEELPKAFSAGKPILEFNIIGKNFFRDFFLYSQEDSEFEDLKFDFMRYIKDVQREGTGGASSIFIEIKIERNDTGV